MSDGGRADSGDVVRAAAGAVTASPRRRLLAFVTLQTLVVAALAGVAFRLTGVYTGLSRIDVARSGPGAALTTWVLVALVLVAIALYIAVPVAVAWYVATRSDRHWLTGVVWAGVTLVSLPWLVRSLWLLIPGSGRSALLGLLGVGGVVLVVAAHRFAAERTPADATTKPPAAVFLGVLLAGSVGVTGFGGLVLFEVAGPATALVECPRCGGFVVAAPPDVAFGYDYESAGDGRGVVTVTYEGGEAVAAEHLSLDGTGFEDVAGADRTAPGPWPATAGGTLEAGDSVTVGVRSDPIGPETSCEIRVRWEDEYTGVDQTVGLYGCGDGAADEATPEPSAFEGGP